MQEIFIDLAVWPLARVDGVITEIINSSIETAFK